MRLIWTASARRDRREIYDYIERSSPRAAHDLDAMFSKSAKHLLINPALGRLGRIPGTRELVVHRHYILVYDVVGQVLRIIGVLHTSRNWPVNSP